MSRSLLALALFFATVTGTQGNAFGKVSYGGGIFLAPQGNAEELATISITSKPGNAAVFLDDESVGTTPTVLKVKAGNRTIRLIRRGYKDSLMDLTVEAGSKVRISLTLAK